MKRIKLKYGSARVEDNCSKETIEALNKLSELARWEEGKNKIKKVCHSFVTDGKIRYLNDCTHHLKGQTVELLDF